MVELHIIVIIFHLITELPAGGCFRLCRRDALSDRSAAELLDGPTASNRTFTSLLALAHDMPEDVLISLLSDIYID